jgi:hypothetical protein
MSFIGSSSKDEPGELYTIAIRYNIAQAGQRRNKRVFDLLVCLALIPAAPFWLLFSSRRMQWMANWRAVFSGKKTWVGYAPQGNTASLPTLKTGVFSPLDALRDIHPTTQMIDRLNFLFAKDWNVWQDLTLVGQMLVE